MVFPPEGGDTLEQVAQKGCEGCECPLARSIQDQARWSFEQSGLRGDVSSYIRGLELDYLKGPFQLKPFCDSMIRSHPNYSFAIIIIIRNLNSYSLALEYIFHEVVISIMT